MEETIIRDVILEGSIINICKIKDECTIALQTKEGLVNLEANPDDSDLIDNCNRYLRDDYRIIVRGQYTDEGILRFNDVKFAVKD